MKQAHILSALVAFSCCLASCGSWNPDPAERLAYLLERNARDLKESENMMATFDFVPDPSRVRASPRFKGEIVVKVALDPSISAAQDSTIIVSDWFWTTYHSRFVRVIKAMEATKRPEESFHVVLKKSGKSICWADLQ